MKRYCKQFLCLLLVLFAFVPFALAGCDPNTPVLQTFTINTDSNYGESGAVYGGGSFYAGQTTTLYASANEGWIFTKWSDDVTNNPRQLVVDKDVEITAVFAEHSNTRVIQARTISSSYGVVYGGGSYKNGETVYLYAIPKNGYKFVKWNDDNTDNPRAIVADDNKSFVASFNERRSNEFSRMRVESLMFTATASYGGWPSVETLTCKDFVLTINGNTSYTSSYGGGLLRRNSTIYSLNAVRSTFANLNDAGLVENELDLNVDVKDRVECKIKMSWEGHEDDEWVTLSYFGDSLVFDARGEKEVYFDYPSYGKIRVTFIYFAV